jgi:hypothetical protein
LFLLETYFKFHTDVAYANFEPLKSLVARQWRGDDELGNFNNSFLWEDKEEGEKKILTQVSKIKGEREFITPFMAWGCAGAQWL